MLQRKEDILIYKFEPKSEKRNIFLLFLGHSNEESFEFYLYNAPDEITFDENNHLIEEIIYEFNFRGINGPTKLKILLPKITKNEKSLVNITGNKKLVYNMKNKNPVYNDFFKVYTLQFIRRKVIPNEKNFQIIFSDYKEDGDDILLQFAQSQNDEFILDFKHPFNNISAFALAITAMASRTFCK